MLVPVAAAALVLTPHLARADGAFPNGQSILVPADRPDEIVLATNFGLVTSEDAGRTWLYSCEQAATSYGRLYQMGPAPAHRLFAMRPGEAGLLRRRRLRLGRGRRLAGRRSV